MIGKTVPLLKIREHLASQMHANLSSPLGEDTLPYIFFLAHSQFFIQNLSTINDK